MWCPYHYITTQRQYATSDPLPMAVRADPKPASSIARNSNHTDVSSNTNTGKEAKITRAARYSIHFYIMYFCSVFFTVY